MTGAAADTARRWRLRSLRAADDERLGQLFADPATAQWNPCSATGVLAWRAENADGAEDFRTWAVAGADDVLAGVVSLFAIDAPTASAEIGFRTHPAARGLGVAGCGLRLATRVAHADLGLGRVLLFHAVGNAASCAVARGAGYVLEAALPANHRYGDGELHDEHRHASHG